MFRRPGGRPRAGLGLARSAVLFLLIATAAALALVSAYVVIAAVPPLPDESAVLVVAADARASADVAAPPAAPAPVAAAPAQPQGPDPVPGVARVAVIGDSFTTGASGHAPDAWPDQVCAQVGCQYLPQFASPRTGWTQPGADGLAVGGRLDAVVAAAPDVVVIAAGAFDAEAQQAILRGSVNLMLFKLERRLPDTRVIVLSPFWEASPAPASVIALRGWIYDATIKHGDTFVNVTDLFDEAHPGLMQANRAAPNDRGQAYVASVVEPFVRDAIASGGDDFTG